jgi:hypothetical protein
VVGDDRTRRLVPAVLSSLALLLGLYAIGGPPVSTAGSRPGPSATVTADPAAGMPGVHRFLDPGPQPRLSRHAAEKPLLTWAILLAAVSAGSALGWWSSPNGPGAAPAGRGRFARNSRAPPSGGLPA